MGIAFHKLHGCGNDFIFIDNRKLGVPVSLMAGWAKKLCERKMSVGADGLVFLEETPEGREGAYVWHFYNSDGSRGEMCGNASRCASWLAVDLGLAGPVHAFGTDVGLIRAEVDYEGRSSKAELTRPQLMAMDAQVTALDCHFAVHFVDTGVPHAVIILPDNRDVDVAKYGAAIRYHEHFAPKGTNVNFISLDGDKAIRVRTYERGVEGETLACGTGAAASVFITHELGLTQSNVNVTTSGGEILGIELKDGSVFLSGAVTRVYTGELDPQFLSFQSN